MKKSIRFTYYLLFLIIFGGLILHAHLRFIGPDPYFSYNTYPQDILKFKNKTVVIINFSLRGWMGNLDDPELSPSPNYVATHEYVEKTVNGENKKAEFEGNWFDYEMTAFLRNFNMNNIKFAPFLYGKIDLFRLNASGEAIGEGEYEDFIVPFNGKVSQNNNFFGGGFAAIKEYAKSTLAVMFDIRRFKESEPDGYLNYELGGREFKLNLFTWGWSTTSSCSHIFGIPTNIDSFSQDEYTSTSYYESNFVFGFSNNNHKSAIRIRKISGKENFYYYDEEENIYKKEKYGRLLNKTTLRAYDTFVLKNMGRKKLYLVALVESDFTKNNFTRFSQKLESAYEEKSIGAELLPFVHFDFGKESFLRAGTSISVFYGTYKYTDVWGGERVLLPGWYYFGEDVWWERPSKGNFWKITNFSEMDAELNVSKKLTFIVHIWTHLTYTSYLKIFGDTDYSEGEGYFFIEEARRRNKLKEFWLGGLLGIKLKGKPEIIFVLNLPVQYDNSFFTEINTSNGGHFNSLSDALPKVRRPVYFSLMIGF